VSIFLFLIIVLICLILSGLISAIETAFTAASKGKLQNYIKKGNRKAAEVEKLRRKSMSDIIGALLATETLLEVSATSVATAALTSVFDELGVMFATIIMTVLIMIYGEIIPKIYAYHYPEKITIKTVRFIKIFLKLFKPLLRLTNLIARFSLRLVGVRSKENDPNESVDELKGAIALHAHMGSKAQHEKAMMESILDLADVSVDEIMTHRKNMVMIDATTPMDKVLEQVLSSPYTRHPVWLNNRENIIGILHTKDLLRALARHDGDMTDINIKDACVKPWFIPESTSLFDQLNAFRERREHLACVVDEYGALLGIVTLEDILEEIVGQIDDEHDVTVPGVRREGPTTVSVHGWVTLRDLNREFDWNLPDEEAATLAGLIIYETEQIPEIGQEFLIHGLKCKITARKRNQITRIRITYNTLSFSADAE
jgi:Mg2+/Co2+ transporter CorB